MRCSTSSGVQSVDGQGAGTVGERDGRDRDVLDALRVQMMTLGPSLSIRA